MAEDGKRSFLRYPVMSWGAEALVMGHLMRRNILAFKARPATRAMTSFACILIPGCGHGNCAFKSRAATPQTVAVNFRSRRALWMHLTTSSPSF